MEKQLEEFAKAAKGAACETMKNYGGAMTGLASYAYAGGPKVGLGVTLAVGIAQWAAKNNCEWDPDQPGPEGGTLFGCKKIVNGWGVIRYKGEDGVCPDALPSSEKVRELITWTYTDSTPGFDNYLATYIDIAGREQKIRYNVNLSLPPDKQGFQINVCGGGTCEVPITPPAPLPPTYQHTTEEGCVLNVNLKSLVQDNDGNVGGAWQIEPANPARAGGSVIGGCNFSPVIYYDGGGGGSGGGGGDRVFPTPIPTPPGDDWWKDLLKTALATAAGNLLAQGIKELLAPQIAPASFNFIAPCNKKPDGTPEEVIYEWDEQDYQSRVLSQQAVIMEILQQHLNWKTPICFGNEGKGDYRTISFISVESSPYGDGRLRKRFRYRSQSGIGLDGVVDHWKDFAFDAGDVCVQHRGSALGSPQVWAASADEGKRVILHAAGEAGIDPNQVGEWSIGGSDNPRYGVFGRMIVNSKGGYYWISSRLGENGRPLVATT